jgi:anti-sigma factor ChrR (cupin superfamily)
VDKIAQDETAPGTSTVASDEGVWEEMGPGIERKVVQIHRGSGVQSYFVRMAAGAVLPGHEHGADEHCVILKGRLEIGGRVYGEGTYHFARDGIPHVPITAQSDALFFIHGAL